MFLKLENPVTMVSTNDFSRNIPRRYNFLTTRSPHRRPWERVACDIVGPFSSTPLGNKYIVVFQDKLTWPDAYSTSTTDAIVIANLLLDNIFSVMGGNQNITYRPKKKLPLETWCQNCVNGG